MASTFNQHPGTPAHSLALTKIVSKHTLQTQVNKMIDSVCSKADFILAKFEHSKLSYRELLELFQEQMEHSSEHYQARLALEVELAHKNAMASVMDSIYARFEVAAKSNKKKMVDLNLVERIPIGLNTRGSIGPEQILDFSLKSHSNKSQPKESSSLAAVRKQVCFNPNDQIFHYDKTDSEDDEDDDEQSQSTMDDLSSIESDERGEQTIDEFANQDDHMQPEMVNNMNPSLPQGQKRKSINSEVKIEHDGQDHHFQVTIPINQLPMSENALVPSPQAKPTKPNGKNIEQLVKLAIESSPSKRLQIQDIYSYIHLNSAYHAQMDRYDPSWHRVIRRIISCKSGQKTFRGIPPAPSDKTQSKSYYWTLVNP